MQYLLLLPAGKHYRTHHAMLPDQGLPRLLHARDIQSYALDFKIAVRGHIPQRIHTFPAQPIGLLDVG
ncbi:hypothetical protein D3C75_1346320 [compost metagenome]